MSAYAKWRRTTLGSVACWGSGGTPKAGNSDFYGGSIPWAVIGDLNDNVVLSTKTSITEAGLRNSSAKLIPKGSVLVAMYGSIGKLGVAGTEMASNQAIAYAVALPAILPKFLFWYLRSQRDRLGLAGKGATQKNIGQATLRSWPIVFPESHAEQRRLVEIIETHLSHLDAAEASLVASSRRLTALHRGVLLEAIPDISAYPSDWSATTTAMAGVVQLGRQRHPDWHTGPNMRPYLRVANVFEDRLDLTSVMEMHWPDDTFEKFRLIESDILLNEGQSPEFLGRPAMYRGTPRNIAFTNSLIRFRASKDVLPEFALLVFRRHMHAGRFQRESRITTNIAHLSAARLKEIEFPIPPLAEQRRLVAHVNEQLSAESRLREQLALHTKRHAALRRAILAAAFSGRLTGRSTDAEIIEETAHANS